MVSIFKLRTMILVDFTSFTSPPSAVSSSHILGLSLPQRSQGLPWSVFAHPCVGAVTFLLHPLLFFACWLNFCFWQYSLRLYTSWGQGLCLSYLLLIYMHLKQFPGNNSHIINSWIEWALSSLGFWDTAFFFVLLPFHWLSLLFILPYLPQLWNPFASVACFLLYSHFPSHLLWSCGFNYWYSNDSYLHGQPETLHTTIYLTTLLGKLVGISHLICLK